MRVLVVGASGFIGRHLVKRLQVDGHAVDAWDRRGGPHEPGLQRFAADLLSERELPLPSADRWEVVFHLAAHSLPNQAWDTSRIIENLTMTARVLEHVAQHARGCRTIIASSAHVYAPSDAPINEQAAVAPRHPYGLSKQLSECWALSMRDQLDVQIVRAFNQVGPGMAEGLLVPDVLARARLGELPMRMNGRNDWKDFLDWRDAMDAYVALMRVPCASGGVWNLCSGRRARVSDLVSALLHGLGIPPEFTFADARVQTLIGDAARLTNATGWVPRHTLDDTAAAICAEVVDPQP